MLKSSFRQRLHKFAFFAISPMLRWFGDLGAHGPVVVLTGSRGSASGAFFQSAQPFVPQQHRHQTRREPTPAAGIPGCPTRAHTATSHATAKMFVDFRVPMDDISTMLTKIATNNRRIHANTCELNDGRSATGAGGTELSLPLQLTIQISASPWDAPWDSPWDI